MTKNLFLLIAFLFPSSIYSQSQDSISSFSGWTSSASIGYQGIHQSGAFIHLNTVYANRYALEIGVGSDFLNSYTATGKYFFNEGINQFYTSLGYGYFSLIQKKEYKFEIQTAHFTLGYQSIFNDHWIVGQELVLVKYFSQKFTLPNSIKYTERYKADEKLYFEIGVYLGYRINWSDWL